jgi:hypothetical protein
MIMKSVDEIFSCNQSTPNHSLMTRDRNFKKLEKKGPLWKVSIEFSATTSPHPNHSLVTRDGKKKLEKKVHCGKCRLNF